MKKRNVKKLSFREQIAEKKNENLSVEAAAGYDEGWYAGKADGFEEVLTLLDSFTEKDVLKFVEDALGIHIGDTLYFIEKYNGQPIYVQEGTVSMIGLTTRGVRIRFRESSFNKTYILNKNVFCTHEKCKEVFEKEKKKFK